MQHPTHFFDPERCQLINLQPEKEGKLKVNAVL